jgi:hypothetical protein
MALDFKVQARASRILPQAQVDTNLIDVRAGRYGELPVLSKVPTKHLLSDEGDYYTATSGYGTTVAQQGQITAFSDTAPLFVFFNKELPGGKRIYLDALRLLLAGTAPVGTVSLEVAVRTDTVSKLPANANQYTNPLTYNVNSDDARASSATIYAYVAANAMVTPVSSGAVRNVARAHVSTGLGITGDEYLIQFGSTERASHAGLTATRAAATARLVGDGNPVIIGPQVWATVHVWWLTSITNVPTWEWEWSWFEF